MSLHVCLKYLFLSFSWLLQDYHVKQYTFGIKTNPLQMNKTHFHRSVCMLHYHHHHDCTDNGGSDHSSHQPRVTCMCQAPSQEGFLHYYFLSGVIQWGMLDLRSPYQGSNLHPLHWKRSVLTIRPPGKSHSYITLFNLPNNFKR